MVQGTGERLRRQSLRWLVWGLLFPVASVSAQVSPSNQELLRQQDRERALRERQETAPDVRLEQPRDPAGERLPGDESPCFRIDDIVMEGDDASRFAWALKAANRPDDRAIGRCLGTRGVNAVMKRVQNAIIAKGLVTTRVLAAPQDLTSGKLTLTVVPGRIRAIRFADGTDSRATWWNAVPAKPGDSTNRR